MLTNFILILIVLGVTATIVYKSIKKKQIESTDEVVEVDDKTYTIEKMTQFVKKRLD